MGLNEDEPKNLGKAIPIPPFLSLRLAGAWAYDQKDGWCY